MKNIDIFNHLVKKNLDVELLEDNSLKINQTEFLDSAKELISNKKLSFDYLMCITSYDGGDGANYGCIYNFYSNIHRHYVEIRVEVDSETEIPSIANIWKTADWHERECYDLMGIKFSGHPNLKRILLSEDWNGHPLRKDYQVDEYYRGMPIPKDKTYWE